MRQRKKIVQMLVVVVAAACAPSDKGRGVRSLEQADKTANARAPSKLEPKRASKVASRTASSGCKGVWLNNKCFDDDAEACRVAGCVRQHCEIRETLPARVACLYPGLSDLDAKNKKVIALVAEGGGPDDGGGYDITLAVAGGRAGWVTKVGGLVGKPVCRARVASYLKMSLHAKNKLREGSVSVKLQQNDRLSVVHCTGKGQCQRPSSGSVTVTEFQPGKRVSGTYSFEGAGGPWRGKFEADWCGPVTF